VIIASPAKDLETLGPERLIHGLQERKIQTQFLTAAHSPAKAGEAAPGVVGRISEAGREVRLNRDRNPSGVYYGIAFLEWPSSIRSVQALWGEDRRVSASPFRAGPLGRRGAFSVYRNRPPGEGA